MPIEHEHKIVLKDSFELYQKLASEGFQVIDQFYVSETDRFRHIRNPDMSTQCVFTFKLMVDDQLLEIEKEISEEDVRLARKASFKGLLNHRYSTYDDDGHHWDIDFILDPKSDVPTFLIAMAEVETAPGDAWNVHPLLADYVDFLVPREDSQRFTNASLTNDGYARHAVSLYKFDLEKREMELIHA